MALHRRDLALAGADVAMLGDGDLHWLPSGR
jgi:hypothetical protein